MKPIAVALLGVSLLLISTSRMNAQVIVSEDFESYADTVGMQLNWGSDGAGALVSTNGNTGNSAFHPGGAVNSWIGSSFSVTPTTESNVVLRADIFDDGTSSNERMTVGLRNGANPLFEMGHYNAPNHYAVRVLSFAGNEGWVSLSDTPIEGWNRYEAIFTLTGLTVTLDIGADGTVDHTFVSSGPPSANAFEDLRFGGPSGLSSEGGPVWFDNIQLELVQVPEPGTYALLGLGLAGLAATRAIRRRHRRN